MRVHDSCDTRTDRVRESVPDTVSLSQIKRNASVYGNEVCGNDTRDNGNRYTVYGKRDGIVSSDTADDSPVTEEELGNYYGVGFSRRIRGERAIVQNPMYLGVRRIKNSTCDGHFSAHVWYCEFLRANSRDYPAPLRGLLIIKTVSWAEARMNDPGSLRGKRTIYADSRGTIQSIA